MYVKIIPFADDERVFFSVITRSKKYKIIDMKDCTQSSHVFTFKNLNDLFKQIESFASGKSIDILWENIPKDELKRLKGIKK